MKTSGQFTQPFILSALKIWATADAEPDMLPLASSHNVFV